VGPIAVELTRYTQDDVEGLVKGGRTDLNETGEKLVFIEHDQPQVDLIDGEQSASVACQSNGIRLVASGVGDVAVVSAAGSK